MGATVRGVPLVKLTNVAQAYSDGWADACRIMGKSMGQVANDAIVNPPHNPYSRNRQCAATGCASVIDVDSGASTKRAAYCSTACRVRAAYKRKHSK